MNIAPFIRLPADPTRTSVLFDVLPRAPGTRPGDMRDAILAIGSHRNPDRLAVSIGAGSVMTVSSARPPVPCAKAMHSKSD